MLKTLQQTLLLIVFLAPAPAKPVRLALKDKRTHVTKAREAPQRPPHQPTLRDVARPAKRNNRLAGDRFGHNAKDSFRRSG